MAQSNERLIRRAKIGDPEAWNQLFQHYQLPLFAYVFELVRDEQTSLDIMQETFINAVRNINRLRDEAKFSSWLFSIAHQKCIQRWRKPRREERFETEELEAVADDDPNPSDWLISKEQEEELMTRLHQLPALQQAVLLLHFLEDFSLEEITVITGTPIGTVKSRLHYGKKALRRIIEKG